MAHIAMAEAARRCAALDRVLIIPAGVPPHRSQPEASDQDRLAMSRLAVRGHPELEVSDMELRRPGPSYTLLTLQEVHDQNPRADLFLVLGWDAARDMRAWHEPERVLDLAKLLVVPRPGLPDPTPDDLRAAGIPEDRVCFCRVRTPNVGATELRRHLHQGTVPGGALDPAVASYIAEHRLYRD
ncbi:MAG: nicotinate (nicotinamide) nucleotide adenylyltransferase [Candidatus Dormibacteraeota bacterium]|nr:nicotinate (nicotinamide) nucleotide adenylyltransferase [Candidatus Dormibacteraeota bacterium]